MYKRITKTVVFLCCMCLLLNPLNTFAITTEDAKTTISTDEDCTLTLKYSGGGMTFDNVPVNVYRIADVSPQAWYTLETSFSASGLSLNGIQSSGEWNTVRSTLKSYIVANSIGADFTAVTNPEGQAVFELLEPGMYFVTSGRVTKNGVSCSFAPALIALPGLETNGNWQYEVTAMPKAELTPSGKPDNPTKPDKKITLKVLKLWKDEDNETARPENVEVEIFRDEMSYQVVTLSEANNWSYSWTEKDNGSEWTVSERHVPEGYVATVEERAETFIITNIYVTDEPPLDEPPTDEPPVDVQPSDSPKTGDTPHIMLYTVLMYLSGLILIILGITGKKNRYEK